MKRNALCIHGHFYQPSREDPLTGFVPPESGAYPYPNWNIRIHEHCYRPNAEMGNFGRISYDAGPTLMGWMIGYDSITFSKIVNQDRENVRRYGVGNAMAQAYHHTILPLAKRQDKEIQVYWGAAEFAYRFGHQPTGMWLPETAVDLESLEILVDHDIEYTILAPWQAAAHDLDVTQPYWVELPSGRKIAVFFFHQELSMRVSFDGGATTNADGFLRNYVLPQYRQNGYAPDEPQMIMIATDGELYGHHQPFRDKFLSYLTGQSVSAAGLDLTFPGLWLKQNPPTRTIKITEYTSWSCHHGVARWGNGCLCTPNSNWKPMLRKGLQEIGDALDAVYVQAASRLVSDPWQLLKEWIHVLQGSVSIADISAVLAGRKLDADELRQLDYLLRAQYNKQRMFTSCGWFFEDFDRIEPRNVVSFAAQAVWWTKLATGIDLSLKALNGLAQTQSWQSGLRADIVFSWQYEKARNHFAGVPASIFRGIEEPCFSCPP